VGVGDEVVCRGLAGRGRGGRREGGTVFPALPTA